jgi:thymidylate synthase (FAD)
MTIELLAVTPDAEQLIETAARTCYQSVGRMTEQGRGKMLAKLLAAGHESPFEHASATFCLRGCSRAMTHQLVRHRLMSVSQKSQRYVSERGFDYVIPPSVPPEFADDFRADMEQIRAMYAKWKSRGLRNEDARYVLPNACGSEMVITANFREWRHIFRMRCAPQAQWEIREACLAMLRELHARAPGVFGDLWAEFGAQRG